MTERSLLANVFLKGWQCLSLAVQDVAYVSV